MSHQWNSPASAEEEQDGATGRLLADVEDGAPINEPSARPRLRAVVLTLAVVASFAAVAAWLGASAARPWRSSRGDGAVVQLTELREDEGSESRRLPQPRKHSDTQPSKTSHAHPASSKKKATSPSAADDPGSCSAPGEDCTNTTCCATEGFQCFQKNEFWSACMRKCDESDKTWSCKKLGKRTPFAEDRCAQDGEDCLLRGCCEGEGLQCYEQNDDWSSCMITCPKKSKKANMTCEQVGERTPLKDPSCKKEGEQCALQGCCDGPGLQCYGMDETASWSTCSRACRPGVGWSANWTCTEIGERAEDELGCAWSGGACTYNKLCCHEGNRCIMKDDVEAYCSHHEEIPEGWNGEIVGYARSEWEVQGVDPEEARGTSLFCFMAVLPGSFEEGLRDVARDKGASIFACDKNAVFETWQVEMTHESTWNSVINTDVFKNVWLKVREDGQYQSCDWTAKVDPDSVFFPDRLQFHLGGLNAPKDLPIYIKNADVDFGFLGAIEVFSKEAVDKLFWDGVLDNCEHEVSEHSGEDGFLKGCMDMIGAGFMVDYDVLKTPHADDCDDPARVCFHAFKDVGSWEGCHAAASR